jgi:hypothetical protein
MCVRSAESCVRLTSTYLWFDFALNVASKHSESSFGWFVSGQAVPVHTYVTVLFVAKKMFVLTFVILS